MRQVERSNFVVSGEALEISEVVWGLFRTQGSVDNEAPARGVKTVGTRIGRTFLAHSMKFNDS